MIHTKMVKKLGGIICILIIQKILNLGYAYMIDKQIQGEQNLSTRVYP